jgi:hypothetical protein
MSHPVPVKPDELSSHLTCAICLNVPVEPVLTPCQHMFCGPCMEQHPGRDCPTCRSPNNRIYALEAGTLSYRIWSEVAVKCGNFERGCAWTGSIVDAKKHMGTCSFADNSKKLKDEIVALKEEIECLNEEIASLSSSYTSLATAANQQSITLDTEAQLLRAEKDEIKRELDSLRAGMQGKSLVPNLFHGSYTFNRFDAVSLSQLIARYLTNPPGHINTNRIYNCVRACYEALERGYSDNPPNYRRDMHMLLATCRSSSWFTDNQWHNMQGWMSEQGWA